MNPAPPEIAPTVGLRSKSGRRPFRLPASGSNQAENPFNSTGKEETTMSLPATAPRNITIFDTTLRDGEQSPGSSMNIDEKLRIARQLELLKVDVIEAGFPIAPIGDFEAVRKIAQTIKGPQIAGLCRAVPSFRISTGLGRL